MKPLAAVVIYVYLGGIGTKMRWDVAGRLCCVECFRHPWLRTQITDRSSKRGKCSYRGAKKAALIEVADLSKYFDNLIQMYCRSESEAGDPLYYLMQDHWQIFNDDLADSGNAAKLITDIMRVTWDDDDGEPPVDGNDLYVTCNSIDYLGRWDEFLASARETEDAEPDFPDALREDMYRYEARLPAGTTTLYRARPGFATTSGNDKIPWTGKEIGASPAGKIGRANRTGKVVLYCADEMRTAIAEVRPSRGLIVSCAQLRLNADVTVLDLVAAARESDHLNPFSTDGAEMP